MKKVLLVITVLFCFGTRGQNYIPLPLDTNHYWSEIFSGWGNSTSISQVYKYKIKDTVVQSVNYKKVKAECVSPSASCGYAFNNVLLRQDSVQRKVFIVVNNQEKVLYNFNKMMGDTLQAGDLTNFTYSSNTYTVTGVDSVFLSDNKYHKRFRYSNWNYAIEGVGGEFGLLTPYFTIFETSRQTICLTRIHPNSNTIYMNPNFSQAGCTPLIMGIKPLLQSKSFVSYPNPVSNKLFIEGDNSYTFSLADLLGNKIGIDKATENTIDLSHLSKGFYFLSVYDGKELIAIEKIVKE